MLPITACYTYAPVDFARAERGALVRAELSPAGEQEFVSRFGPGVRELRGRMLGSEGPTVSVLVDAVLDERRVVPVDAAAVRLSREHVRAFSEKRLAQGRSALFGTGIVIALIVLTESLGGASAMPEPGLDGAAPLRLWPAVTGSPGRQ
jgi:hypothetical protein